MQTVNSIVHSFYDVSRVPGQTGERIACRRRCRRRIAGRALIGVILLVVALAAAISVDVVRTAYDIKGDESTYVAMTLSLAYDGDLSYQRRDLERFWGLYKQGPEGVFLKRGKQFRMRVRAHAAVCPHLQRHPGTTHGSSVLCQGDGRTQSRRRRLSVSSV